MSAPRSWTVGDVKVTAIVEGDHQVPAEQFLPDLDDSVPSRAPWLVPDHLDANGLVQLRIQAFVVEADDARIVVDTCIGNDKPRSMPAFAGLSTSFLDDFEAAGFAVDSIDAVVCTHLHVDHVGWNTRLVDGRWEPTFPKARYLLGEVEYRHWSAAADDPDTPAFIAEDQQAVLDDSIKPVMDAGLVDLVPSNHQISSSLTLVPTPGHTPGHHSVRLTSGDDTAVITGDLLHSAAQVVRTDICSVADSDPILAASTRQGFLEGCSVMGTLMIGTHLPGETAYRVVPDGDSFRLS